MDYGAGTDIAEAVGPGIGSWVVATDTAADDPLVLVCDAHSKYLTS